MPNPRGRPSKEMLAQRALAEATKAAQEPAPELPVETPSSPEPIDQDEKSELTYRAPRNDARDRAMKEITDRDIQTKTGLGMELGLTDEEKPKEPVKEVIPPDPAPPTAESMLHGGKFSQSPQTVRVKVDGEEFDAPSEEVEAYGGVKSYQIAKAAENRLQKANEVLAEAKRLQGESKPKETPNEQLKKDIEILRWGTPDESADALNRILESKNKQVDQNELVQRATDAMRHDEAVKNFDKEFTDIGARPMLLKLVVALRNERLQKGHPGNWDNFYRSLGNEVRAEVLKQSQPSATPLTTGTPSQASVKEERKSSIVNLPTATAQRAELPEEPKTETRDEIFAKMRKRRGLPTT